MLKIEKICATMPFDNGAGPDWSYGNSPILRLGDRVFVTNSRVLPRRAAHNRTSLELYEKRDGGAWRLVYYDEGVYQREPCPILYLGDNRIGVTANPTARVYAEDEPNMYVDCVPLLYVFDVSGEVKKVDSVRLTWDDPEYHFMDHSYRSFAVDGANGNIFFTNQYVNTGGAHCYALTDPAFRTIRADKLEYPVRSCYHNIAVKDGETYVFAIRDIVEPVDEWREYKFQKTGRQWDYDFRVVYLNYSPDLCREGFGATQVVSERDATCGWLKNLDCCYDKNGDMWMLISAQNVHHPFMRERFFPEAELVCELELYRFSRGVLVEKRVLDRSREEEEETRYSGFFHTAADGELHIVWGKKTDVADNPMQTGIYLSSLAALDEKPAKLLDTYGTLFGSKTRLGAQPSDKVDIYWPTENAIFYSCHELK